MLRSHRLALAAAAVIFGLSSCGDLPESTTSGNPQVIHLGGSPNSATPTAAGESADKMMMPYMIMNFVFDGTLPELSSSAHAWQLPAGTQVDAERVARMAQLLGVEGDVRELPADQGGGWMVGAADYSTANLNVSKDGMLSWWFNPNPSIWENQGGGCVSASSTGSAEAVAPPDSTPVDSTVPVDTIPVDTVEPCEVQPPVGVPTADEATAQAKQLFADLGYDTSGFEFDVYADEWGAYVTAYLMVDGLRSPLTLSVGYGAEGVMTWASGFLGQPQDAGEYPLVGLQSGVDRMNEQGGYWMGFYGPAGAMVKAAGTAVSDVAVSNVATSEASTEPAAPVPTDSVPVCDPAADCVEGTLPPPEEVTVHLTDAKMALTMVWDVDGTVWLVPAYTFTSDDGGEYTVIAVDQQFVTLPDVGLTPEPMPVDDGTATSVDQAAASDALVGLDEAAATALAEENGWVVRVVRLDGEDLAATMDYVTNRVNVAIENGVVTEVISIG